MRENVLSVRLQVGNDKAKKDLEEALRLAGCRVIAAADGPESVPDILIVEIDGGPERELEWAEKALESGAAKGVFLTGEKAEPGVLMRAMRMGVREFFPQPINKKEVEQAVFRFKAAAKKSASWEEANEEGRTIAVFGSKGGVGTTTIAVNLALALAGLAPDSLVALVDLKPLFGQVPLFLDLKPPFTWGDAAKNIDRLDSTYLMSVFSRHSSGIYVLGGPQELDGMGTSVPEAVEKILTLMKTLFEYIVIDAGNSLDDITLPALRLADTVFAAAELNVPSLVNLSRLLGIFRGLGYPEEDRVKVLINRNMKRPAILPGDAEKTISKKISWFLPNDYAANSAAVTNGKPVYQTLQKSELREGFRKLALSIVEEAKQPAVL